jgi:flagellin
MSLSLNTNVAALSAHKNYLFSDSSLTKSIGRLSSGLRIRSAADDPSGLAISQRLQNHFKGMERANMNSQDAISYMQTAESALSETQNILQRMRELAMQASNGTLTASDRQQIQKEVDQLKQEVNTIADSAEYNTKKLLDGTASALWSASSDTTNVIVKGKVKEGNYELEINTTPVNNHVLKSDIFKVKAGAQGVSDVDLNPTQASLQETLNGTSNASSGILTFDFGNGLTYTLAVTANSTAPDIVNAVNNDSDLSQYIIASSTTVTTANDTLIFRAKEGGISGNNFSITSSAANVAGFTTTAENPFTGGNDNPSGITSVGTPSLLPDSTAVTGTYTIYADNEVAASTSGDTAHVVSAYEQPVSDEITAASTSGSLSSHIVASSTVVATASITAQSGSGYAILEITQGGVVDGAGTNEILGRVSFDNGKTWYNTGNLDNGTAVNVTDGTSSFELSTLTVGNNINTGDKILIALNDRDFNSTTHTEVQVVSPFTDGQGNSVQNGPAYSFTTNSLNNTATELTVGYMNSKTGDVTFGNINMNVDELASSGATNTDVKAENNIVRFNVTGSSGPAYGSTKLYQIDKFYDANGNFILGESGKEISVYNANGDKATIFLNPQDTIEGVANKIEKAITSSIADGGLGMGTGDSTIDNHVADFVVTPTAKSAEALKGTIVIRSPWMGTRGKLYFSADENITKALSLTTIQDPEEDPMDITVRDAHTGVLIGSETVADSTLHSTIQGVEVQLNPNTDVTVNWDSANKKFVFTSTSGTAKEYVHIVNNAHSFQSGAYQGQTIDSYIGEMTAKALHINKVLVVDQSLAQKSLTILDNAIDAVSSERARIGAIETRLEHNINSLSAQIVTAKEANSRIVDLDIAKESTEFSKDQMKSQAAQSMLAQANKLPQNLLQLLR